MTTWTCDGTHGYTLGSSQEVQHLFTSHAEDGDTIAIPAGAYSWTSGGVTFNSSSSRTKMVKVSGAGMSASTGTRITCPSSDTFYVFAHHALTGFDISGIRFIQNTADSEPWAIRIVGNADTYASLFRIHGCYFQYLNGGSNANPIILGGLQTTNYTYDNGHPYIWGLIDGNDFYCSGVTMPAIDVMPEYSWTSPTTYTNIGVGSWRDYVTADHLGTWKNVFIEDNNFYAVTTESGHAILDANSGGCYVARYNYFYNVWSANHGADSGTRSGKLIELYNNTYVRNSGEDAYFGCAHNFRGGSGVVYNNQFYDADHKGSGIPQTRGNRISVPASITGTDLWRSGDNPITFQYYRAFVARGDDICGTYMAGKDPLLGCDNKDHTGGSDDGWVARDQPGSARGDLAPTWAYGHKWKLEPVYLWNNRWAGGATLAAAVCEDSLTENYVRVNQEYYQNTQRPNYVAYTYPHPLAGVSPPVGTPVLSVR